MLNMIKNLKQTKKISLLLVEDEIMISKPMQKILERLSDDIEVTYDGLEAWELYQQRDFTIVLTDLQMPNMNGSQLIEKIKENNSEQIIIVITAFREGLEYEEAKKLNPDYILEKPFSLQAFLKALNTLEI